MDIVEQLRVTSETGADPDIIFDAADEIERLRKELARIENAPVAIMDTRDVLCICAPTEDVFPSLYALQGHRVRLVLDDVDNAIIQGPRAGMEG